MLNLDKLIHFRKKFLSKDETVRLEVPVPNFIPYACHYDENTVLTKNGELLQVIKIVGFSCETVGASQVSLRETVRQAILENIKTDNFAVCFHTVRSKRDLDPPGNHSNHFSEHLHEAWCQKNYWHDKYVNELYVTIIHEGMMVHITSPKDFLETLSFRKQKKRHDIYLEQAHVKLDAVVQSVLSALQVYGAKRLTIVENDEGVFSELLQFFGKIIYLSENEMPVPIMDLSEYLATHKVAFGNNVLEVRKKDEKRFGAVLSVKEYVEIPAKAMDQFLQLPIEFIVSQTIDFISAKKVMKVFEYQDYILQVSKDESFRNASGIKTLVESDKESPTDYGQSQLTIMILSSDIPKLEEDIKRSMTALSKLGLLIVREDLYLEHCFWSQLPANFSFIARKRYMETARVGGFASLHNFPAGNRLGNHWGPAATIFRTMAGTPYFFNFHQQDNGHTVIIGPQASGRMALLNFLISESRKFNGKLFVIDQYRTTESLMQAMGGHYVHTTPRSEVGIRLNPLQLEDNDINRHFLKKWFEYLLGKVSEAEYAVIDGVIEQLYQLPMENRRLSSIAALFGDDSTVAQEGSLRQRLSLWVGEGKYAPLFDNAFDALFSSEEEMEWGICVAALMEDPEHLVGPVLSYYLHRINRELDGTTPTMIVVEDAWSLMDNPLFAPYLGEWLDYTRKRNAMVILASRSIEQISKSNITADIMSKIATQIFLPNPEATEVYKKIFGLSKQEFALLNSMKVINRHFLLKQGEDAIVAELNLAGLDEVLAILSGTEESRKKVEESIQEAGDDPDVWLPVFYNKHQ